MNTGAGYWKRIVWTDRPWPIWSNTTTVPYLKGRKTVIPGTALFQTFPYVRICKLSDIYDAMISRRSYKEAANQVAAATTLFRTYVKKDPCFNIYSTLLFPPSGFIRRAALSSSKTARWPMFLRAGDPLFFLSPIRTGSP